MHLRFLFFDPHFEVFAFETPRTTYFKTDGLTLLENLNAVFQKVTDKL